MGERFRSGLEHLSTPWALLRRAHDGSSEAIRAAQHEVMERYRGAAHRYLLGALHDANAADELFQEFAFRFVRGDFRNVRPEAGRFRDYLRVALSHLINDYRRNHRKQPAALPDDLQAASTESENADASHFVAAWRIELMNHAWSALRAENEQQYEVMLHFVRHPDTTSGQASETLSATLGKLLSPTNIRVIQHRARERFARLLLEEVARTLESPSRARLGEELRMLNLLKVCGTALQCWGPARDD